MNYYSHPYRIYNMINMALQLLIMHKYLHNAVSFMVLQKYHSWNLQMFP